MEEGDELVRRAAVRTVDRFDGARVSGDIAKPLAAGICQADDFPDVGKVLDGVRAGRQGSEDITWYKSVGFAGHDLVLAAAVLEAAEARGLGTPIDLGATEAI